MSEKQQISHKICNIWCWQTVARNLTEPVGHSMSAYWCQKSNRTC